MRVDTHKKAGARVRRRVAALLTLVGGCASPDRGAPFLEPTPGPVALSRPSAKSQAGIRPDRLIEPAAFRGPVAPEPAPNTHATVDDFVRLAVERNPRLVRASLAIERQQTIERGEFYTLLPPHGDIHYVETVSDTPSVSIHLLANDTARVWRHRFDPEAGTVNAFRSGYSNVECPPESTQVHRV